MTSSNAGRLPEWSTAEHVPVSELAPRQGVGPVTSIDELARPECFGSDEELAHFLTDLYAARHAALFANTKDFSDYGEHDSLSLIGGTYQ